jgi:hypothetical protein
MTEPRVPGSTPGRIELPCGETISPADLDLGMREFHCACGADHAVVMDVHPPARFVPEFLVEVLESVVEVEDEFETFGTPHVMGAVIEEFPEKVATHDAAGEGEVGYAMVWITDFDDRRLHEIVVELLIELMDHAISHAEDQDHAAVFDQHLEDFDVEAFVDQYRAQRDLESEHDTAI